MSLFKSRRPVRGRFISAALIPIVLSLAFVGCYYPPSPRPIDLEGARALAAKHIRAQLGGLSQSMAFMAEGPVFQKLHALMTGGTECSGGVEYDPLTGEPIGTGTETCGFVPGDSDFTVDLDEMAEGIIEIIDRYVFTSSQVYSISESDLTFLLAPDVFCGMFAAQAGDSDAGGDDLAGEGGAAVSAVEDGESETGAEEQACRDFLTAVPVYLNVMSYYEDELDVSVQIGQWRMTAFDITMWNGSITAYLDLGSMESAIEEANSLFKVDGRSLLDSIDMSGYVSLYLTTDYAGGHTAAVTVSDGTAIQASGDGKSYVWQSAAASATLLASGDVDSVSLTIDSGAFLVSFPYQLFVDWMWGGDDVLADAGGDSAAAGEAGAVKPEVSGTMRLRGDGFGAVIETAGRAGISIQNVNLGRGQLTMARDFDTLAAVELNPDTGGKFDALMAMSGDGNPYLAAAPGVNILVDWNFDKIAGDLREMPQGLGDETWGIALEGTSPAVEILQGESDQWLKVDAGTLSFSTNAIPGPGITVPEGKCLAIGADDAPVAAAGGAGAAATEESAYGEHVLMSAVSVVDCL